MTAGIVLVGCAPSTPEVLENRKRVDITNLAQQFLAEPLKGSSPRAIKEDLTGRNSLTVDGSTIVVGPVGANQTVTLICKTLTLQHQARIVTNGNHLVIYVLDLDLKDNLGIVSFVDETKRAADGQLGSPGTAGSNSGLVEIHVLRRITGATSISLPGQDGGNGGSGSQGVTGSPGSAGGSGSDGFLNCLHPGENGGTGGNGGLGNPGGGGGRGGNGGDLILYEEAVPNHETHFSFTSSPGEGGGGGVGGAGGPGGPGGANGGGSKFCGGGDHAGANGNAGLQGPSGSRGERGSAKGQLLLR